MTRFARAKGSKSSNERKPEEATSWSEMKKSILSKRAEKPQDLIPREVTKNEDKEKQLEWAPLENDGFGDSVSLLRQHLTKKNKVGKKLEVEEGKEKKKRSLDVTEEEAMFCVNGEPKKKKKKEKACVTEEGDGAEAETKLCVNGEQRKKKKKGKTFVNDESEEKVKEKRKKKRKKGVYEEGLLKKKRKVEENSEILIKKDGGDVKKFQEKGTKSKGFKKRNYDGGGKQRFETKKKKKSLEKSYDEIRSPVEELIINGEKIKIIKFQGFYVTFEDAERLKQLRSEMKKQGIPKDKLEAAIKLERRRAEKALSRLKKNVCFHCRSRGHLLSGCPDLQEKPTTGTGICYKCGSTEHSAGECKVVRGSQFQFAECFVCGEQGHIARQCPDNPRGLYPQGGACRECGDVTHLRKDCPRVLSQKEEEAVTVGVRGERDLECLDEEIASREKQGNSKSPKKNATVKF